MKSVIKLIVFLSLLAACAPAAPAVTSTLIFTPSRTFVPSQTPIPSETPTLAPTITPTFTPTPTSTSQPPLVEHEWNPETVLISMVWGPGDGGGHIGDLGPPTYILYADGNLFMLNLVKEEDRYRVQVLNKKLNRLELCQHLNTLDQIGYLNYLPSDYSFNGDKPLIIGAPSLSITVNAWKLSSGSYYGLSDYLENDVVKEYYGQKGYPIISPALQTAYRFLDQYPSQGLEVYKPERALLWIVPAEYYESADVSTNASTWQLKNLSLKSLIDKAKVDIYDENIRSIILNGEEAKSIYSYFGNEIVTRVFEQEMPDGTKRYYALAIRPLLPYELPGEYGGMSQIPAPDSPKPNFKLTCYPSDGVLPIPTPNNP